jgi:hypothetical protein
VDEAQRLLELALDLAREEAGQDAVKRLVEAANSPGDLLEACRRVSLAADGTGVLAFSYLTGAVRQILQE